MCLIIHHPVGHTLSKAEFLDICARNSDGFGLMTARKGVLHTHRILSTADAAYALYLAHGAGKAAVLHWRFATHGTVTLENVHPFSLTKHMAFVHNGILNCGTPDDSASDTAHLARHILAPIARDNPDALFDPATRAVLAPLIGSSNKLAVMDGKGRVSIFNRSTGVEYRGCWYSNTYAWDAPTSLMPKYKLADQYSAWSDTKPHHPQDVPKSPPLMPLRGGRPDPYDVDVDIANGVDVPGTLLDAYWLDGEIGAMRWAVENAAHAAYLCSEWHTISASDVMDRINSDPAAVAEWLGEIIEQTA